jgi:hypothetical protein
MRRDLGESCGDVEAQADSTKDPTSADARAIRGVRSDD